MPYLSKRLLNELSLKSRSLFESIAIKDCSADIKKGTNFDIFLSYSLPDQEYAEKLYKMMTHLGFSVYFDLKDKTLDRNDVDEETARRIASIMDHCRSLIYVHSASAKVSKWCPWELGYMSGKTNFRCSIIPLLEDKEDFPHQEYLELYPIVDYAVNTQTQHYEFWVNKFKTNKYVSLKQFINGTDPFAHN